jgi:AcrR family transcriptional regulator
MRRPLTRTRIIAAALALADREGMAAISLRRIASRLGVHVTSLYNHVPTKEAVLDGIVEHLMGAANLPEKVSGWEEWVRQFADGLRAVARKHPGAITAFHHRPVQGPQAARFPETGLQSFRAAGFDISEAYSAVKSTALVVLGLLIEEVGSREGQKVKTDLRALPPERFPQAHELRKMAVMPDVWAYTIDTLVAGLAANLRSTKARSLRRSSSCRLPSSPRADRER